MPLPMMPAPMTPTVAIASGERSRRSTPVSFLLRSVRKKTLSSALFTGEPNISAIPSASAFSHRSASQPSLAPSSMTSSASNGFSR